MIQIIAQDQTDGSGLSEIKVSTQPDFADAEWQPFVDHFTFDQFVSDQFMADQFMADQFMADQFMADQFVSDQFVGDSFSAPILYIQVRDRAGNLSQTASLLLTNQPLIYLPIVWKE